MEVEDSQAAVEDVDYLDALLGGTEPPGLSEAVEQSDGEGQTLLHRAAAVSDEVVRQVLEAGANPTPEDNEGQTPLMVAARCGKTDCVGTLISHSPESVKYRNAAGNTALHIAALYGQSEVCEALLDAGADVDSENLRQETALMMCTKKYVRSGGLYEYYPPSVATLRVLMSRGADTAHQDSRGMTAAHNLVFEPRSADKDGMDYNVVPCIQQLLSVAHTDKENEQGKTFRDMLNEGGAPYHDSLKMMIQEVA